MQHPILILERYWGYTSFKPQQEAIIDAVLNNNDVFALLPTGGGKSICFQVPTLIKEGICIVISPLIALMQDQVQQLKDKGIKAMAITSGIHYNDLSRLLDNCIYGNYKFLYLSPERLQQDLVQERIKQMPVNLIAVDEAHCISQWGNDFRPAYSTINALRELHPQVNCIALTATATPKVVKDIIENLDFINPSVFKQSFKRDNITLEVLHEEDKLYALKQLLKPIDNSVIIYTRNRRTTIELSNYLETNSFKATFYHGGLTNTQKTEHLNLWIANKKLIMVATNAFGMGIDKPNVELIVHYNLPESIESYFQEAGRAGRNGKPSKSVILKNNNDLVILNNQFLKYLPNHKHITFIYKKLCSYFQIPYGERVLEQFDFNFNGFCKTYNLNTLLAYNSIQLLDRTSVISLSKQFKQSTQLQFIATSKQLFYYFENNPTTTLVCKSILRTYSGVFDQVTQINLAAIENKTNLDESAITQILIQLEKDNIITLKLSKSDASITFIQPREDEKTINRIRSIIEQQNKLKQTKIAAVLNYIKDNTTCKSVQLLNYFGEQTNQTCENCMVCENSNKQPSKTIDLHNKIITLLKKSPCSSRTLLETLKCDKDVLVSALKLLLEKQVVTLTATNTYKLT